MQSSQRGFGLVELLIAVGITGIFLAVSIPMFLSSVKQSQTAEASIELSTIARNAKRGFAETGHYVIGTATELPVQPHGSCCQGPDNRCAPDPARFAADPVWRALDFEVSEPSIFYYNYTGTAARFTATATGDLDCDGAEVMFTLNGTAMTTPSATLPVVTPSEPWTEPTPE